MSQHDDNATRDHPDYDALQREARDRRTRIAASLDSLRHRLAPDTLKEQTMNRMTNRMSSGASHMGDMVRGNPVPLAMIGIGLGWMLLSRSGMDQRIAQSGAFRSARGAAGSTARYARDTFYSAAGTVRDTAGSLYDRAGDMASDAYDSAGDAASRMTGGGTPHDRPGDNRTGGPAGRGMPQQHSQGGRSMTASMGRQIGHVTTSFWDLVEDHPLVAGVMGVALGAALGASIPGTRYEERWVGDYAGQVTSKAKDVAQDAIERGTRAAQAAAEAAREHVAEAVDDVKGAAKEEIDRS
ncbi:hypothetical protein [Azospirillum sp. TSO22-1]|uniref:hypothetical protein n=1 Tax=Azospirillum sp. TSO22-1 TaxID=716789 RepID=UPI000D608DF7|nr:hypothetical protein [Azospirillum sp. TSO22-1]PWC44779.1 hypothetical protein TSO221_17200 [Azospirillum sp. TSO22-1]